MDSDIDLDISFRFLGLTENQASELKNEFENAELSRHFKTNKIVGTIPLSGQLIEDIALFIKLHSVSPKDVDIFISFITEYDSRIIDMPDFVARAAEVLGARMTLSYTII